MTSTTHGARTSASLDNTLKLNNLCIQEDSKRQVAGCTGKKRRDPRIVGGVLRQFGEIVCKKVEAKGRTTYREVADEIIEDLASFGKSIPSLTMNQLEEKNIRRRAYDAFNVLKAINVIASEGKEIRWLGFPKSRTDEIKEFEERRSCLVVEIQKKINYLQELEEQYVNLHNLVLRNQQKQNPECHPHEGVALPFILVQAHSEATVEIEISEDARLLHFDFNGSPFSLHEHFFVLEEMRYPQPQVVQPIHRPRSSINGSFVIPHRPVKVPRLFSRGTRKCKMDGLQK